MLHGRADTLRCLPLSPVGSSKLHVALLQVTRRVGVGFARYQDVGASLLHPLASAGSTGCIRLSLRLQGNPEDAKQLLRPFWSNAETLAPPATKKRGSKRQAAPASDAMPASDSLTDHIFMQARACLLRAQLNRSSSNAATSCVMLAGCGESLTQRRLSHTLASTSSSSEMVDAACRSSSRASKTSRAPRGAGKGRRAQSKGAPAAEDEDVTQSNTEAAETGSNQQHAACLQDAGLLLQAYHASAGHPLLHR